MRITSPRPVVVISVVSAVLLLVGGLAAGCAHQLQAPLATVPAIDLERYQGTWYELARLPAPFQEGCQCTTATYTLRDDGKVGVLNQCVREGKLDRAEGRARVTGPGQLQVTFFWPFSGDYNVIDLDSEYRWAVVGSRDRRYAWLLSRSTAVDDETKTRLVGALASQGYDTGRLIWTEQESCPAVRAAALDVGRAE